MTVGELSGAVALVTGGGAGIGRAICLDLAAAGARVVVIDRSDPSDVADQIAASGGESLAVVADVTSEQAMVDAGAAAVDRFGGIDALVNNAGVFASLASGPFEQISVAQWRLAMDVNVMGSFLATKAVVGAMRTRGGGRVVNIASTTALKGTADLLHYTSSKGAVLAMTRALARELGPDGILVNAVAPGFTVSTGVEQNSDHVAGMRVAAPGGRVLKREMVPEDIVGAVRFLCGPSSGFITGQTLVVDGGAYFH
ncbi:SDR family oxidoreductase [Microbacterium sp. SYP-A9085]|uniref:SDR family NAD(P)-dependent oxidoreductase n=1 Tax=Microbacterium sp. SYP-A9085 TaxID=2664454 RepID=UPI00129A5446|nr:SDR family oxidoreductase [Microbacterium sp. SYP-A9085]MRH28755.1 SDR family oxidoreductase [Microbacterium sp. SYP-A9085]